MRNRLLFCTTTRDGGVVREKKYLKRLYSLAQMQQYIRISNMSHMCDRVVWWRSSHICTSQQRRPDLSRHVCSTSTPLTSHHQTSPDSFTANVLFTSNRNSRIPSVVLVVAAPIACVLRVETFVAHFSPHFPYFRARCKGMKRWEAGGGRGRRNVRKTKTFFRAILHNLGLHWFWQHKLAQNEEREWREIQQRARVQFVYLSDIEHWHSQVVFIGLVLLVCLGYEMYIFIDSSSNNIWLGWKCFATSSHRDSIYLYICQPIQQDFRDWNTLRASIHCKDLLFFVCVELVGILQF